MSTAVAAAAVFNLIKKKNARGERFRERTGKVAWQKRNGDRTRRLTRPRYY